MKPIQFLTYSLLFSSLCVLTALGQGSLTPPGAPGPSMKTLDQIEARTPISSLPIIISTSGSYFFTGNLTFTAATGDAIDIGASDVTLDLNGFTLRSATAVTGAAISISGGLANITVKNGNIMGTTTVAIAGTPPSRTWTPTPGGFVRGIDDNSVGAHFMDLSIRGCRGQGIFSSSPGQAIIERVSCVSNGAFGIFAESGCLIGCTVRGNAVGGIIAPNGSVAINNGGDGISAVGGNIANSTSSGNANDGLEQIKLSALDTRKPVQSLATAPPYAISDSGSYYLTGNITVSGGNAIQITSDDVTLDLNGFTIKSSANPAAGNGVIVSGARSGISIYNGHIRGEVTYTASPGSGSYDGAGFLNGICVDDGNSDNILIRDLCVKGCKAYGIDLSGNGMVDGCTVHTAGDFGILCSMATRCLVENSYGGIKADIVADSYGQSSFLEGIDADSSVSGSYGRCDSNSLTFIVSGLSGKNVDNCHG